MASRILLEPAQSCLLGLLLTVPLVIMYLTGKSGLFAGVLVGLRQEAGVSTGMMEWSLEITVEPVWSEARSETVLMSPCLIQNSKD